LDILGDRYNRDASETSFRTRSIKHASACDSDEALLEVKTKSAKLNAVVIDEKMSFVPVGGISKPEGRGILASLTSTFGCPGLR
jgi:hypothetical protein